MFEIIKKYHIITNFPKGTPIYMKVWANFVYFLTGIVVHQRKNQLNHWDLVKARVNLKKGDVVLWGNLREVSSLFIKGPVTHASLYIGRKKFVEAVGDGVTVNALHHFFTEYDTLIILRLPKKTKNKKRKVKIAIETALQQVGKPYDFGFHKGADQFFCTELVNYAYQKAKHNTKLETVGRFRKAEKSIVKKYISSSRALHPIKMAEDGNFDVVFMSHNLQEHNKISLKKK